MARIHKFDEATAIDMRVDLRRTDVGVAKHGLQGPQVRASFQQMRGKSVAQHMGADPFGRDAHDRGQLLHQLIKADA